MRRLYWFADDVFLGAAEAGRGLDWDPRPGTFTVRAVDDLGRADSRSVTVAMAR